MTNRRTGLPNWLHLALLIESHYPHFRFKCSSAHAYSPALTALTAICKSNFLSFLIYTCLLDPLSSVLLLQSFLPLCCCLTPADSRATNFTTRFNRRFICVPFFYTFTRLNRNITQCDKCSNSPPIKNRV
jgi:hypothetical protein